MDLVRTLQHKALQFANSAAEQANCRNRAAFRASISFADASEMPRCLTLPSSTSCFMARQVSSAPAACLSALACTGTAQSSRAASPHLLGSSYLLCRTSAAVSAALQAVYQEAAAQHACAGSRGLCVMSAAAGGWPHRQTSHTLACRTPTANLNQVLQPRAEAEPVTSHTGLSTCSTHLAEFGSHRRSSGSGQHAPADQILRLSRPCFACP